MTEGPTELLPSAASAGPRLELPNGEAFNHADCQDGILYYCIRGIGLPSNGAQHTAFQAFLPLFLPDPPHCCWSLVGNPISPPRHPRPDRPITQRTAARNEQPSETDGINWYFHKASSVLTVLTLP